MLKVILNRLNPQAEEIIATEQLGSQPEGAPQNRSSALESFVKSTSYIIDLKKNLTKYGTYPYGAIMRKYNINANLVRTIESLYDKATSAVQMNDSMGE